jgi:hypothetical protein
VVYCSADRIAAFLNEHQRSLKITKRLPYLALLGYHYYSPPLYQLETVMFVVGHDKNYSADDLKDKWLRKESVLRMIPCMRRLGFTNEQVSLFIGQLKPTNMDEEEAEAQKIGKVTFTEVFKSIIEAFFVKILAVVTGQGIN